MVGNGGNDGMMDGTMRCEEGERWGKVLVRRNVCHVVLGEVFK